MSEPLSQRPITTIYDPTDIVHLVLDPDGSSLSRQIDIGRITQLVPSGDLSGAQDYANITYALANYDAVVLGPGEWITNQAIVMDARHKTILGHGTSTKLTANAKTFNVIEISDNFCNLANLRITGGLNGVWIDGGTRICMTDVYTRDNAEHGIVLRNTWVNSFKGVISQYNGLDGCYAVSTADAPTVNAIQMHGCAFEHNTRNGMVFRGAQLLWSGVTSEGNGASGLKVTCNGGSAYDIDICGNYFEGNGTASIELEQNAGYAIVGGRIQNNYANTGPTDRFLYSHDLSGGTGKVRYLDIDRTNVIEGSGDPWDIGDTIRLSKFDSLARGASNMSDDYRSWNDINNLQLRKTVTEVFDVECNTNQVDAIVNIIYLNDNTLIHEVSCRVIEAFDGTAPSFAVGLPGTANRYIDPTDVDPTSLASWQSSNDAAGSNVRKATDLVTSSKSIIATWTNTGGTAGKVRVYVTHSLATRYATTIPSP